MKQHSSWNRRTTINRLKNEAFTLIVIGGGITGAGIALDAVSRGSKRLWWKCRTLQPALPVVRRNSFMADYAICNNLMLNWSVMSGGNVKSFMKMRHM